MALEAYFVPFGPADHGGLRGSGPREQVCLPLPEPNIQGVTQIQRRHFKGEGLLLGKRGVSQWKKSNAAFAGMKSPGGMGITASHARGS